jgi:hypothetical protein
MFLKSPHGDGDFEEICLLKDFLAKVAPARQKPPGNSAYLKIF